MAKKCTYDGTKFSENQAIFADGTSFNCFNGEWLAQGSTRGPSDTTVNPNVEPAIPEDTSENIGKLTFDDDESNLCYYNFRNYSSGAPICLDGTSYRCDFGKWMAAGSCIPTESESSYGITDESDT